MKAVAVCTLPITVRRNRIYQILTMLARHMRMRKLLCSQIVWFAILSAGLGGGARGASEDSAEETRQGAAILLPLQLDLIAVDASYAVAWSAMRARFATEAASPKWQSLVDGLDRLPIDRQLEFANRAINLAHHGRDIDIWGRDDYWATPAELLARGGDCEDFATAKFMLLKDAGVSPSRMLVVVLRATLARASHAVLVVHTADGPMVLDSLKSKIYAFTPRMAARMAFAVNDTDMLVPRKTAPPRRLIWVSLRRLTHP